MPRTYKRHLKADADVDLDARVEYDELTPYGQELWDYLHRDDRPGDPGGIARVGTRVGKGESSFFDSSSVVAGAAGKSLPSARLRANVG